MLPFQLHEENIKIQENLKAAMDVRFMKEGEVTILRKNIEKVIVDQPFSRNNPFFFGLADCARPCRSDHEIKGC
jgi:hypothetical protein